MLNKNLAMALGALTGLVGLAGMIRLASGAFTNGMSTFAWVAILSAMLPWIVYAAWRGRHGHLSRRGALAVLILDLIGVSWYGCSCSALLLRWPARLPRSCSFGSATGRRPARPARSGLSASRSCAASMTHDLNLASFARTWH